MKFMVSYDGSNVAQETLKVARRHASVWKAELEVVKAVTRDEPLKHSRIQKMEGELNQEITRLMPADDPPYNVQLLVGSLTVGEQLMQFAKDEGVEQIFIGIEKKSKVDKFLFGSTAQYVILHAPCPVVTIQR